MSDENTEKLLSIIDARREQLSHAHYALGQGVLRLTALLEAEDPELRVSDVPRRHLDDLLALLRAAREVTGTRQP